ncbi:MAG TPA: hypothetical protein V6D26_26910, partial [Stenomitos sp.]
SPIPVAIFLHSHTRVLFFPGSPVSKLSSLHPQQFPITVPRLFEKRYNQGILSDVANLRNSKEELGFPRLSVLLA